VSGAATPPVADVADPTDLAVLGCLPSTGSAVFNDIGGLPGLVRATYPGRLRIIDPALTTPIATPTTTPLATATATPVPIASPCSAAPAPCRPPFVSGKSSVRLVDHPSDAKDRLQWKWTKGAATTLGELGDPTTSGDYALCLYDDGELSATLEIPAAGTCQGKPCWRAKPTGFQYRNKDALPDGITQLTLRAGADGKASLQAKGAGLPLPMPALDLITGTLRVQLRNRASGLCWDTTFSQPFHKQTAEQLRDRAD
jgi:hypothetical protein